MKYNNTSYIIGFFILSLVLASCSNINNTPSDSTSNITNETISATGAVATTTSSNTATPTSIELKAVSTPSESILFNGTSITYNGSNAQVNGQTITITKEGNYEISGTLENGQIIINTDDKNAVQLILNGVNISNSTSAPIYVQNAKQTIIHLADNTTNSLSDATNYVYAQGEDEPNAPLFSKDEMIINGNGTLNITGNSNDGISSKDSLLITGGIINVQAKDDGIRGKDLLQIDGGTLNINVSGDALKSDNEENGTMILNGGTMNISAGDDAVHAEYALEINGGDINITKSYEGFESQTITINDGNIHIVSSDDGMNAAGGSSETSEEMGMGMKMGGESSGNFYLYINGGNITVNAGGDGLDANGSIVMTGGNVIVYGPTSNGNGSLDYDKELKISGGTLIAAGSSGMVQNISTTSTQNSILIGFDTTLASGSKVEIKDESGNIITTFTALKNIQAFLFSGESLKTGSTYTYFVNGTQTGTFTIETIANSVGNIKSGGMGGGRGGRGGFGEMTGSGEMNFRERPQMGSGSTDFREPPEGMMPPDDTNNTIKNE